MRVEGLGFRVSGLGSKSGFGVRRPWRMSLGGENLPLSLLTPQNGGGGGGRGGTPAAFPWRARPPTPRKLMDQNAASHRT